jgi:maltose alpha-D-glucosyltransferase/alpha-amylase
VHPSYGTRRDFRTFLEAAHDRGLRVITELVVNHTSDQHPWFQAARRARPGSSKRHFYVWSDTDQKYAGVRIIFTDTERSNWTWDPVAGAYYWHRFFHHQPDLNFDNPHVRRALHKVMRYWLDQGVDGMRLDAVPYLIEREGTICENLPETHEILRQMRADLDANYRNRMLLAEANQWPSDVQAYFGDGDECHMAFHFPLMPRLFMALRQEDRHPISEILYQTPGIPDTCQWAIFLRNHDELTLEMVTDEERDYMYQAYAHDPQMRLNVGIRRRLAPLMENNRQRIELLNSLLFSLPGTPIVYYGDEIGMGDNIYLGDRNGVRTPMQWTADRNAGFSRADPARLFAPVIMDSVYGYQSVNVEAQERSPFSPLNWVRRMIALRQRHRTFGRGSMEMLRPENRRIFAFLRRLESEDPILVVANLSRTVQAVSLDLARFAGLVPVEMTGNSELPRIAADTPYFLTLGPYACYWLLLKKQPPSPITVRPRPKPDEVILDESPLLLGPDWRRLLESATRELLERQYLPAFLKRQRWFARRAAPLARVRLLDWGPIRPDAEPVLLALIAAEFADGAEDRYIVPLTLASGARAEEIARQMPDALVARVAGARKGIISSHLDPASGQALLELIGRGGELQLRRGRAHAFSLSAFHEVVGRAMPDALAPAPGSGDQSNTSIRFGEQLILKIVRRLWPGVNPELELGRFLTEDVHFPRVPRLAGGIEYFDAGGHLSTLAVLHTIVEHQTDGWKHALGELERYFDAAVAWDPARAVLPPALDLWIAAIPEHARTTIGGYLEVAANLGRRTAELHLALSSDVAARTIGVGVLDREGIHVLQESVLEEVDETLAALKTPAADAPPEALNLSDRLVAHADELRAAIRGAAAGVPDGLQISRVHGDYHLGQVLLHEQDFSIVDFEGEPTRSIEERRGLYSPLRDVAGMVRSFHYAAGAGSSARPPVAKDLERITTWARWWQTWVTASFLKAYRTIATGAAFLPSDPKAATCLLRLLLFEKALYEIRYEMSHRPGWVRIPVSGVLDLLGARDSANAPPPAPIE